MRSLIFAVILSLVSIKAETKEPAEAESNYMFMFGIHQLLSVLAEAPLSLAFYTTPSERVHKIKIATGIGPIYEEIRYDNLNLIRSYVTQDSSGVVEYTSSAPENFMGGGPGPSELKSIIDEFDMGEVLFVLRGGILSCILIPAALGDHLSTYNEYGADHLKQNEKAFIINSLAMIPLYLATKNKLLYILLNSNALTSFLSLIVRYYGRQHDTLSMSSIPYMLILTVPTVVASSYAGIKHNNYMLKAVILLTPVIAEHILSWLFSLYSV